jgi:hypothetical protein
MPSPLHLVRADQSRAKSAEPPPVDMFALDELTQING